MGWEFFIVNLAILIIVGNNIVLFDKYIYYDKLTWKKHILFVTLFATIMTALKMGLQHYKDSVVQVPLKVLVYVVLFVLIITILRLRTWRTVFVFCLTLASMAVGEIIILATFLMTSSDINNIVSGDNLILYSAGNIFINLFQMMVLQVIKIKRSMAFMAANIKNRTYRHIAINILAAVLVMIFTMVIVCFYKQEVYVMAIYVIITAIVVICNILSIIMVIRVDFRDEKLKLQEEYNEILIDLKHKFFGIISILSALVEDEDIQGLKCYTTELNTGFVERIRNMPIGIKNNKLFYLLAMKTGEAHDRGVSLKVVVPYEVENIIGMREEPYIYIVNELLSNAIENASRSIEKEVYIKIENLDDSINTIVDNSIGEEAIVHKAEILNGTKQKHGRGHGIKEIYKLLTDNTYFRLSITERFTAELVISKK